ncbi:MAG: shikimate dehydrogenase [Vicinamibacterales bacterium]
MQIDIDTRMVTLLGKPLGQSFAARMQNAAYEAAGLNMLYYYTEVGAEHLGDIINGVRYMNNHAGLAVTKPNKVEVLKYVDEIDPLCEKMGAANTIVIEGGRLKAYNTDGTGFLVSLREETGIRPEETVFFSIGAGGAGRAICSVLAFHGAKKIYVMDAVDSAASGLVEDINTKFAPVAEFVSFRDRQAAYRRITESDMVMNCTGIGMGSSVGKTPVPKEVLRPGQFCYDAIYNPARTRFLADAEEVGCRTLNGLGMSLYQGAAQIELWSGKPAPVEAMRKELMAIVAEKNRQEETAASPRR